MPNSRQESSVRRKAVIAAVIATVAAAGCSGGNSNNGDNGGDEPDPFDEGAVAADSVGTVDEAGCDLPITFDIAEDWTADSMSSDAADEFEQGGFTAVCEIKGHDAGWIAFVRVWKGAGDPEEELQHFVDDASAELVDSESRAIELGGDDAFEISYDRIDPFGESNRGRAFALSDGDHVVVVSLSGLDTEEYEGALPAYILARNTVEPS